MAKPQTAEWETGLIEIAPKTFAYIQGKGTMGISNAGLVLGMGGPLLVDALMVPRLARSLKRAVKRATPVPPRYVFQTHHHIDHIGGTSVFLPADVIATEKARREIVSTGLPIERFAQFMPKFASDFELVKLAVPNIAFERNLTLYSDSRRVELLHLGAAHTVGDAVAYLPEEQILYAGDLAFFQVTPLGFQGHIGNWIKVIDELLRMDVDQIVPGHGPVGGVSELRDMQSYLKLVHSEAKKRYDDGMSVADAARDIELGQYSEWAEPERINFNVGRCYQEFAGDISPEDVRAPLPALAGR
ncbi:MAG TPA: MBL fold metallo-hydrolase [Dehalococcoidia bacterium]|nr:MBL fold metallo-hydrolase [Dehalococcoidia bacterium]